MSPPTLVVVIADDGGDDDEDENNRVTRTPNRMETAHKKNSTEKSDIMMCACFLPIVFYCLFAVVNVFLR